jgi:hypothetical protein
MKPRYKHGLVAVLVMAAITASTGCATRAVRPPDPVDPGPQPSSAAGVLRRLEWAYNNRSCETQRDLFAADFVFAFSSRDSAGADYRTTPWTREDELISACHLIVGGAAYAPASNITLLFDRNFVELPDPRSVAWDPTGRWRRAITTHLLLDIRATDGSTISISGQARFFFVRGDSARIPDELRNRGFAQDSTRWYMQRWEDETVSDPGGGSSIAAVGPATRLDAQPTRSNSWGSVKVLYRGGDASRSVVARRIR